MINVVFQKLAIRNFLSIGEDPVVVDFKVGLNIITGRNYDKPDRTNGVGKSTIADALYFALFGTTIRDLSKDDIYNNLTSGKCVVALDFDIIKGSQTETYRIERYINPSKCLLTKDGIDITRSGIPQTTEFITELIHTTPEMFQNSVIMTVNNTIPFMSQKKTDKRKFIEGILSLGVFGDMLLLARSEYNEIKRLFDVESAKIAEVDKLVALLKAQRDMFEKQKQDKLAEIDAKTQSYSAEVTTLQASIVTCDASQLDTISNNIKLLKTKQSSIDSEIEGIQKESVSAEFEIRGAKAKIADLKANKGTCKFCLKNIDELTAESNATQEEQLNAHIQAQTGIIAASKIRIDAQKELREKLKTAIGKLEQEHVDLRMKIKDVTTTNSKISQLNRLIADLATDKVKTLASTSNHDAELTKSEARALDLSKAIDGMKKQLAIIDAAKFIVSEEGVKSILVKKILNILNTKLAYYLKKMEANCIITFNEYFEEQIVNEKGKTCSYFNFSGAERKSIDLACLFTFMDIRRLQGDVTLNVSMYDELLDTSLDEKGVDLVLDILRERVDKYREAVYIISHRRESIKHVTGDVIYIEKRGGISTRTAFQDTDK